MCRLSASASLSTFAISLLRHRLLLDIWPCATPRAYYRPRASPFISDRTPQKRICEILLTLPFSTSFHIPALYRIPVHLHNNFAAGSCLETCDVQLFAKQRYVTWLFRPELVPLDSLFVLWVARCVLVISSVAFLVGAPLPVPGICTAGRPGMHDVGGDTLRPRII